MENFEEPDKTQSEQMGGRLKLLSPDELNDEQKKLYDYLIETKISWAKKSRFTAALQDGRLIGPFNGFLYSPQMARAFNDCVDAEAKNTSLSARIRQIIVLTVGVVWNTGYEIYAHTAVGKTAGLDDTLINAIKEGREPENLIPPEAAAYRFTYELLTNRKINEDLYRQAVENLKEKGIVDMVNLIGLYLATSAMLNTFEVPVPNF